MKILMVNKFLYPKGGAETYVFKLGEILKNNGHEVQYFGMEDERNIVGNDLNLFVSQMDLHSISLNHLKSPLSIISNKEAELKIVRVLEKFQPNIVHLNNIQFYITPSILLGIEQYKRRSHKKVRVVYTAHDYQLICPSHGLFDTNIKPCELCLHYDYWNCFKTKCLKNSRAMSLIGTLDAFHWLKSPAYSYIDTIICPSAFLKKKLDIQKRFARKTVTLRNFVDEVADKDVSKENYILEFGKLCTEKGTYTLLEAVKRLPDLKFVFAGYGEAEEEIKRIPNAEFVGFKTGDELEMLVRKASLSVYPSEWYENCPFSVIESQMYRTPVIGANIGGIPELIDVGKTGELFEPRNAQDLIKKIRYLTEDKDRLMKYTENCKNVHFETEDSYYQKLMQIYGEKQR